MVKNFKQNKKAIELSLQTIVILILVIITFIVVIYFFANHYGSNSDSILKVGNSTIDGILN